MASGRRVRSTWPTTNFSSPTPRSAEAVVSSPWGGRSRRVSWTRWLKPPDCGTARLFANRATRARSIRRAFSNRSHYFGIPCPKRPRERRVDRSRFAWRSLYATGNRRHAHLLHERRGGRGQTGCGAALRFRPRRSSAVPTGCVARAIRRGLNRGRSDGDASRHAFGQAILGALAGDRKGVGGHARRRVSGRFPRRWKLRCARLRRLPLATENRLAAHAQNRNAGYRPRRLAKSKSNCSPR